MKRYNLLLILIILLQSCDGVDINEKEYVEKKIAICFDGNPDKVYPWVSFAAHTEDHESLCIVQDNDTIINKDGTFSIERGKIPTSGQIVLYSKTRESGWIYLGVTYRKRMKTPSYSDELIVRIKGYVNDIQYLDTTHVMHAFNLEENINESDYIYKLKI